MEINSLGRLAIGILQLLKHDGLVSQTAANQLSHFAIAGSGCVKETDSPKNKSTVTKPPSFDHGGQTSISPRCFSTLSSLETELLDSQSNCAALSAELSNTDASNPHFHTLQHLSQKLETMQRLLTRLRTEDPRVAAGSDILTVAIVYCGGIKT
ncbi:hypothetical protein R6Q59_031542 [Mikania micrantha]